MVRVVCRVRVGVVDFGGYSADLGALFPDLEALLLEVRIKPACVFAVDILNFNLPSVSVRDADFLSKSRAIGFFTLPFGIFVEVLEEDEFLILILS